MQNITISQIIDEISSLILKNKLDEANSLKRKFDSFLFQNALIKEKVSLYNKIKSKSLDNNNLAYIFIQESLKRFKLDKDTITKSNENLNEFYKVNNIQSTYRSEVSEAIDTILNSQYFDTDEDKKLHSYSVLAEELTRTGKKKLTESQIQDIKNRKEKLDEKKVVLSENEQKIVNLFLEGDKEKIKKYFNELLTEASSLILTKLKKENMEPETRENLNLVEEKLNTMSYDESTVVKDVVKILDLIEAFELA